MLKRVIFTLSCLFTLFLVPVMSQDGDTCTIDVSDVLIHLASAIDATDQVSQQEALDNAQIAISEIQSTCGVIVDSESVQGTINTGTDSDANYRQSPPSGTVIDSLPNGTQVSVIATALCDGNVWFQAIHNENTGWLFGNSVSIAEADTEKLDELPDLSNICAGTPTSGPVTSRLQFLWQQSSCDANSNRNCLQFTSLALTINGVEQTLNFNSSVPVKVGDVIRLNRISYTLTDADSAFVTGDPVYIEAVPVQQGGVALFQFNQTTPGGVASPPVVGGGDIQVGSGPEWIVAENWTHFSVSIVQEIPEADVVGHAILELR